MTLLGRISHKTNRSGKGGAGWGFALRNGQVFLRVQGWFPAVHRQRPLANADTRQISACHCEERSGRPATWQSVLLAVGQNEKEIPSANTHLLRISPGTTFLQPQTPGRFLHVIARSEATWQSVLLAVGQNEKQSFGRIREALRSCPKYYHLARFLCGDADCRTSVRTGSQ